MKKLDLLSGFLNIAAVLRAVQKCLDARRASHEE